jgi:hypothetical protein
VPQEVSAELQRVVRRWQQLPLDRALSCMPTVRLLLDHLAAPSAEVPDLGPAVLMDQLAVLVYDACAPDGDPSGDLARRLADGRRELRCPSPDSR